MNALSTCNSCKTNRVSGPTSSGSTGAVRRRSKSISARARPARAPRARNWSPPLGSCGRATAAQTPEPCCRRPNKSCHRPDKLQRRLGDMVFFPRGNRGLVVKQLLQPAFDADRAAVDTPDGAGFLKLVKVPAHRRGRDFNWLQISSMRITPLPRINSRRLSRRRGASSF